MHFYAAKSSSAHRGEKGRERKNIFYNKFNVSPVLVSFLDSRLASLNREKF
jgi:hypothetical protein